VPLSGVVVVAVDELESAKSKLVPVPCRAKKAGMSSKPVICAMPVPLNDIEPALRWPFVNARRSNE